MKNRSNYIIVIVVAMALISFNCNAQISSSTISVKTPNETITRERYDSTHNLPDAKKINTYIGQLVYMHGLDDKERGYPDFYSTTEFAKKYGTTKTNHFNTAYQDLFGKYFYVDTLIARRGYYNEYEVYLRNRDNEKDLAKYFLKLPSTLMTKYELREVPWITVSYYNYLNSQIGKEYICHNKEYITINGEYEHVYCFNQYDIKTGEKINFEPKDMWRLVEISTDAKTQRIIAVFQNKKGNTTFCQLSDFEPNVDGTCNLISKERYNNLLKKYGSYYTDLWLNQKYAVGMPEELFELLMGTPSSKKKSSYQEQWIYKSSLSTSYFYFKDKKLTGWN